MYVHILYIVHITYVYVLSFIIYLFINYGHPSPSFRGATYRTGLFIGKYQTDDWHGHKAEPPVYDRQEVMFLFLQGQGSAEEISNKSKEDKNHGYRLSSIYEIYSGRILCQVI